MYTYILIYFYIYKHIDTHTHIHTPTNTPKHKYISKTKISYSNNNKMSILFVPQKYQKLTHCCIFHI